MKKIVFIFNKYIMFCLLCLVFTSCSKGKYYNYDGFANIKMPILSIEYTPVIDLDEIDKMEIKKFSSKYFDKRYQPPISYASSVETYGAWFYGN